MPEFSSIQSTYCETAVNTPGYGGLVQGLIDHDTIPTMTPSTNKGPPESPEHCPFHPPSTPAQILVLKISPGA